MKLNLFFSVGLELDEPCFGPPQPWLLWTYDDQLPDDNPTGDDGVLHVGLQHPVQLGQGRYQVRPLGGGLEGLQATIHLGHVAAKKHVIKIKYNQYCGSKFFKFGSGSWYSIWPNFDPDPVLQYVCYQFWRRKIVRKIFEEKTIFLN